MVVKYQYLTRPKHEMLVLVLKQEPGHPKKLLGQQFHVLLVQDGYFAYSWSTGKSTEGQSMVAK